MQNTPDFQQHFCNYPGPHSDGGGVGDRGTASISDGGNDFSDLFDWEKWDHDTTDVTSPPSEGTSEEKAVVNAPAAPAPATPFPNEDHPMTDFPSEEPKPAHVWPSLGPVPPRDVNLQVDSSPSPSSTEMCSPGSPQAAPHPNKKTRTLKSHEETSRVRVVGSCYGCKIRKTAVGTLRVRYLPAVPHRADRFFQCNSSSTCEACKKQALPELRCIRKLPCEILGSSYGESVHHHHDRRRRIAPKTEGADTVTKRDGAATTQIPSCQAANSSPGTTK